jgi:hypothetical protein
MAAAARERARPNAARDIARKLATLLEPPRIQSGGASA